MNESELKPEYHSTNVALKPILFSMLILISGIVIGAGLTLLITEIQNAQKKLPPGPEYMSNRMVQRLIRELELSPEQQQQLKPIVSKHMRAIDEIRREARPRVSKEIKQMNDEILSLLNEPQKQLWLDRMQRMQDHFSRMRSRRGPGGERNSGRRSRPDSIPDEQPGPPRLRDERPPREPVPPNSTSLDAPQPPMPDE